MNYYLNTKKKSILFTLRYNIYNQRVDNNVTKQFREIHGVGFYPPPNWKGSSTPSEIHNPIKNTEYFTDEITDAQGLDRAHADRKLLYTW